MDAQEISDLATAVFTLRARPTLGACQTQTGYELSAQLTSGLGVDDVVYGFMRDTQSSLVRMQCNQPGSDLLGRTRQSAWAQVCCGNVFAEIVGGQSDSLRLHHRSFDQSPG